MRTQRRASGQTLVIMALALPVLLGMIALTIEIGRVASAKGQTVNGCDCAALAGAAALPNQALATQLAQRTGGVNRVERTAVSFPAADHIAVVCDRPLQFLPGRFWGLGSTTVRARAVAQRVGPATTIYRDVVPIGVSSSSYTQDVPVTLTMLPAPSPTLPLTLNTFVALVMGDSDPGSYIRNVEEGYPGEVSVGDTFAASSLTLPLENLTAIVSDPATGRARFQQAQQPPYNDDGATYTHPNYPAGNPRIIVVPLVDKAPDLLNFNAVVQGFGAFYVTSVDALGLQITGRFLSTSLSLRRAASDGTGADYGVGVYRLVE